MYCILTILYNYIYIYNMPYLYGLVATVSLLKPTLDLQ